MLSAALCLPVDTTPEMGGEGDRVRSDLFESPSSRTVYPRLNGGKFNNNMHVVSH